MVTAPSYEKLQTRIHDLEEQLKEVEKKVEKKLKESRGILSSHLENTPVGVVMTDVDFKITEWNPAAEKIFGFKKLEVTGRDLTEKIVPDDQIPVVTAIFDQLISGKGGKRNINENITSSGTRIICDWYNTILYDAEGKISGYASLVNDITIQVEREKKLSWFAKVIEQADEEVVVTSPSGEIQYVNPSFEKNTGYTLEEVMGQSPAVLKSGHHGPSFYKKMWSTLLEKKIWRGRIKNKTKNGTIILHDMVITPIIDSDRSISGFVSIRRNITEQVKKEQQEQQSRKMEAIGTLAGGIAHDFNNILSGIFGYAQLALSHIENTDKIKSDIEQILLGAKRATELVQQILTFSRQTENKKQEIHPYLIVKEALKLIRSTIPATIDIKEQILSTDKIFADPTQLYQIVMNLCTNAYHAMRETGGTLFVTLEKENLSSRDTIAGTKPLPGSYIKLEIKDTGVGMTADILNKIFDPYFTTKPKGEGTGLGLAVVIGIINEHNGYISAESVPAKGSVFRIYFPIIKPKNHASSFKTFGKSLSALSGTERIMVVDDEKSILHSTRDMLEDQGYVVRIFCDGESAFQAIKKDPSQIDLLITDMTMPKMTGEALAFRAGHLKKGLPVILCTGNSDSLSGIKSLETGISSYLRKPFEAEHLLKLVRKLLDQKKNGFCVDK